MRYQLAVEADSPQGRLDRAARIPVAHWTSIRFDSSAYLLTRVLSPSVLAMACGSGVGCAEGRRSGGPCCGGCAGRAHRFTQRQPPTNRLPVCRETLLMPFARVSS
jgi:hypothetical protein